MNAHFKPIPDFLENSLKSRCPITGQAMQKGSKTNPLVVNDGFVLRGPEITYFDGRGEVSLGYFDVRPEAIEKAAVDHLGMVSRDAAQAVADDALESRSRVETLGKEIISLREQVSTLTLGNAEMIVQMEGLRTELSDAYEDLYPAESDDILDQPDTVSLEALAEAELAE